MKRMANLENDSNTYMYRWTLKGEILSFQQEWLGKSTPAYQSMQGVPSNRKLKMEIP